MYNYFIIEKDKRTINSIKRTMEDFVDFNCIGSSDNYNAAMNMVLKYTPHLIFINLDSAIENPFQFVGDSNIYSSIEPEFVAISSYKEKSYDAIKAGFYDFLLCPFPDVEIRKTILNFKKKSWLEKEYIFV